MSAPELDMDALLAGGAEHMTLDDVLALVAEVKRLRRVEEAARNFAAAHWSTDYWRALVDAIAGAAPQPPTAVKGGTDG